MKNILLIIMLIALSNMAMAQKKDTVRIKTSSICDMCKKAIEGDLVFEKGITYSELDLETQIVTVVYKPKLTDPAKIRTRLNEIGYDADSLKAYPSAVEKLPECCKPNNSFHKKLGDPKDNQNDHK
jgi:mercuric ion binding protein